MSIYSEIPLDKFPEMVEVFLDPDNEVFFGPITEKEREISKLLPRRTLDPKYPNISSQQFYFKAAFGLFF